MARRLAIRTAAMVAGVLVATAVSAAGTAPTLQQLLDRKGQNTAMVRGSNDFAVGDVRLTFLVIPSDGKPDYQPSATVWVAPSLNAVPVATVKASSEAVGIPGKGNAGDVQALYVAHLPISKPGKYWVVAQPDSGPAIQAYDQIVIRAKPAGPAVGSKAFPSQTPTLASAKGDLKKLTTATPPDTALLRYSIAGSLKAHTPFVVVFATPKFCTSRTCGPVVDVVDSVRRKYERKGVRFIHVEIYADNDIQKGPNKWVREWHLPSEPWTFVVGRDGVIKARFEGSLSQRELGAAVQRVLS